MGEESAKNDDAVAEWEAGLPSSDDITPLSHSLISAELASAFKISPEPPRTSLDVNCASQTTLSSLRSASNLKPLSGDVEDEVMTEADKAGSNPKRSCQTDNESEIEKIENCADDETMEAVNKRPRLVWTPQLHKRFVDVVAHLGLKNAVPKTIMQLMNVEGLTRENIASHLQKYRLYVKRMQGLPNEGPSPSDPFLASTSLPEQSFNGPSLGCGNGSHRNSNSSGNGSNNHVGRQIPVPYHMAEPMMPMPMVGMATRSVNPSGGLHRYEAGNSHYHYHHHHHHYQQQYSNVAQHHWSGNKNNNAYPHEMTQNNN